MIPNGQHCPPPKGHQCNSGIHVDEKGNAYERCPSAAVEHVNAAAQAKRKKFQEKQAGYVNLEDE